jgi:hypothetical protein
MYFVNYKYGGILFLSIFVNTKISEQSQAYKIFCILEKQRNQGSGKYLFKDYEFTHIINLWLSHFISMLFQVESFNNH